MGQPDEPRQITKGLLDALVLTPVGPHGEAPMFLDISIRDMPGFRATLKIEAVQEIRQALDIILGPRDIDIEALRGVREYVEKTLEDTPLRKRHLEALDKAITNASST